MWCEIHSVAAKGMIQEVWQIAPKPKRTFEIRLIIWEVTDVP